MCKYHLIGGSNQSKSKKRDYCVCAGFGMTETRTYRSKENVFTECQQRRPSSRRVHNSFSTEQAGRIGTVTVTRRFSGSHISVACKAQNVY